MKLLTEWLPDENLTQLKRLQGQLREAGVGALIVTDPAVNLHCLMEDQEHGAGRTESLASAEDQVPPLRQGSAAHESHAAQVSGVPAADPELVRGCPPGAGAEDPRGVRELRA